MEKMLGFYPTRDARRVTKGVQWTQTERVHARKEG